MMTKWILINQPWHHDKLFTIPSKLVIIVSISACAQKLLIVMNQNQRVKTITECQLHLKQHSFLCLTFLWAVACQDEKLLFDYSCIGGISPRGTMWHSILIFHLTFYLFFADIFASSGASWYFQWVNLVDVRV